MHFLLIFKQRKPMISESDDDDMIPLVSGKHSPCFDVLFMFTY